MIWYPTPAYVFREKEKAWTCLAPSCDLDCSLEKKEEENRTRDGPELRGGRQETKETNIRFNIITEQACVYTYQVPGASASITVGLLWLHKPRFVIPPPSSLLAAAMGKLVFLVLHPRPSHRPQSSPAPILAACLILRWCRSRRTGVVP
jgi:hypothetical protein